MFFGEYEHTLDDKGRLFLPAEQRDELGEMAVLARGMDGQVNVYPLETWTRLAENVSKRNQAEQANRDISRLAFAIFRCPIDKQGRLLVPLVLRKHGSLDTNLVILGVNDHLEIWSRERWQETSERLASEASQIAQELAGLGLVL